MNQSDIEFTMGLDTSAAEQKLNQFQQSIRSGIVQEFSNIDFRGDPIANSLNEQKQNTIGKNRTKQREITEEIKAQNREHNDANIKLGKTLTILGLIKAAWEAIKKTVTSAVNIAGRLNQEKGFFSVDARATFEANRDKTRAMVYRGEENLGKAAPFSAKAVDEMVSKMQEIRLKAMRGEGIGDDQYVIAMQRLFDKFGIGENAKDLLSNGNVNLYDLGVKMLNLLENKGMPALEKIDGIQRDLLTGDILKVFGKEISNGIAANINKNAITGENVTAIQRLLNAGGNAVTSVDLTGATTNISTAFANLKVATDKLTQVFLAVASGPLSKFIGGVEKTVDEVASQLDAQQVDTKKLNKGIASGEASPIDINAWKLQTGGLYFLSNMGGKGTVDKNKLAFSFYASTAKTGTSFEDKDTEAARKDIEDKYGSIANYVNTIHKNPNATTNEKLAAIAVNMPAFKTGYLGASIEYTKELAILQMLWNRRQERGGSLPTENDESVYGSDSDVVKLGVSVAKATNKKKFKDFNDFINKIKSDRASMDILSSLFAEGGKFDFTKDTIFAIKEYLGLGVSDDIAINDLISLANSINKQTAGDSIKGAEVDWYDRNRDKVKQYSEVEFNITYNLPDGTKRTTNAIATDDIQ